LKQEVPPHINESVRLGAGDGHITVLIGAVVVFDECFIIGGARGREIELGVEIVEYIGERSVIGLSANRKSLVSILNKVSPRASGNHGETGANGVAYNTEAFDLTWMNCESDSV
jgi:hypothetical protein